MTDENWIVTDKSVRPAGPSDACCYCKAKVGLQHENDCVIRRRTVVVNCTIEMVVDVPEAWDEDMINFRYNESSYCADNIVRELERYIEREESENSDMPCLCEHTLFQYVREADENDEKKWGIGVHEIKQIEA